MDQTDILKGPDSFFLGAGTPGGFFSLFDELCDPDDGWRLYILKGGPGTGKSSFLKKIAAAADKKGLYCERIFCSSDPDSLDGVILPGRKLSFADGTPPHTLEPRFPGVCETLIDLGRFRDDRRLRENAKEILRLTRENGEAHKRSAAFLRAAAGAEKEISVVCAGLLEEAKLKAFCDAFAARELNAAAPRPGKMKRRFLNAFTPGGRTSFYCTVANICERVIVLEDETGVAAAGILDRLARAAQAAGTDGIRCLSPMDPARRTAHLLLPDVGLALLTSNRVFPYPGTADKTVRCTRFFTAGELKKQRSRFAFGRKAENELLAEACERLKEAKTLHDELEAYYIDAMDFDAENEFAEKFIKKIF